MIPWKTRKYAGILSRHFSGHSDNKVVFQTVLVYWLAAGCAVTKSRAKTRESASKTSRRTPALATVNSPLTTESFVAKVNKFYQNIIFTGVHKAVRLF